MGVIGEILRGREQHTINNCHNIRPLQPFRRRGYKLRATGRSASSKMCSPGKERQGTDRPRSLAEYNTEQGICDYVRKFLL